MEASSPHFHKEPLSLDRKWPRLFCAVDSAAPSAKLAPTPSVSCRKGLSLLSTTRAIFRQISPETRRSHNGSSPLQFLCSASPPRFSAGGSRKAACGGQCSPPLCAGPSASSSRAKSREISVKQLAGSIRTWRWREKPRIGGLASGRLVSASVRQSLRGGYIGLKPRTTPIESPQSNGMAEADRTRSGISASCDELTG